MGSQSLSLSATSSMDFKLLALSFLLAGVLAVAASPINDDTELLKETDENEALEDDLNQLNDEDDREDDDALDELDEDRLDEDEEQQPLEVDERGFFSRMRKRIKRWRRTYNKVRSYWDMFRSARNWYRGYRRDTGFRWSFRNRALKVSAGSGKAKASKEDNADVAEEAAKFADQIEKLEMEIESGIARDQDVQ